MKERFMLQRSTELSDGWVCTDTDNGIVCIFEHQAFNETQQFTALYDIEAKAISATELARIANEMGAWLQANHYDKILP